MLPTLPISSLINVSVSLSPPAAQSQNLSTLLILGSSDVIDVVTRLRSYPSLTAVGNDFGTSAPEYLAATLWFAQSPQPTSLLIGRWAQAATHGLLQGGPESAMNQLLSTWTPITNGGFHVAIDGGASTNITGLNFSAATTLPGVAAIIQTGLTGASLAATCSWDANLQCFQIKSNSTGATSSVSFLTAPTSGTDISGLLEMQAVSAGAFQANGIAAETALAAAQLFDNQFGMQWYALHIIGAADADHQAVGPFIEATTTKHFYGVATQEVGVLSASSNTDIAFLLQALKLNKTAVQYSSTSPYSVVSLLARILTVDYSGQNTAITLMFKQEPGVAAENLNATQMAALLGKNCNVFVNYNNSTAIIQAGTSASGQFIDTVIGADNWAVAMQTATYNLLFQTTTKVPQTDKGTNQIVTTITGICTQFENDGFLAPGNWTGPPVPGVNTGDWMPTGFHVSAPPVATQAAAQRSARLAVPITVLGKLAGAVHTANVAVTINP